MMDEEMRDDELAVSDETEEEAEDDLALPDENGDLPEEDDDDLPFGIHEEEDESL